MCTVSDGRHGGVRIDAHARDYVYGLGSSPLVEVTDDGVTQINIRLPGRLVAVAAQTGGRYLLQDHLGSTTVFTGSGTAPDTVFDYTPYGDVTAYPGGADPATNYLFQGHEYEPELSLYNFKARLYSPSAALFLSTDPAGTSISPYTPFGRNPVNYIDLDGHAKQWADLVSKLSRRFSGTSAGPRKYSAFDTFEVVSGHGNFTPRLNNYPETLTHSVVSSNLSAGHEYMQGDLIEVHRAVREVFPFSTNAQHRELLDTLGLESRLDLTTLSAKQLVELSDREMEVAVEKVLATKPEINDFHEFMAHINKLVLERPDVFKSVYKFRGDNRLCGVCKDMAGLSSDKLKKKGYFVN